MSVALSRIATRVAGLSIVALLAVAAGCGPSAGPSGQAAAPTGTLVVVIQQGPERVPFEPKVARIQRANEQLTRLLGHSIQIELDGSLLPQTHDGAQDVIARLVEDVVRELDALGKQDEKLLAFARGSFEHLVVRYAPAEAAAREDPWRRRASAKLDLTAKTIDVARAEAEWRPLGQGEISSVLYRAFSERSAERYGHVLPDALPRTEHESWFEYHARGGSGGSKAQQEASGKIGSVEPLRVRGMVMLHGLALRANDAKLAEKVRAWLVKATSDFASVYHHHADEVESAAPTSPFRQAETAYVAWLRAQLPKMTHDERAKVASHLWVIDFRKPNADRDRFATYAFPGIDPMAFAFDAIDAWLAAGRPPKPGARESHPYFDTVVCPASSSSDQSGQIRFATGRCSGDFYRWALADPRREDVLVTGTLARNDAALATTVFYNARRALRGEAEYLRFLRRFETAPVLWKAGADVHREVAYRPSTDLLEEARRLWRAMPPARGHALLWFARHTDVSYHPESDWPDLVQGLPADDAALAAFLDLGWEAFELLPAAWPGIAKSPERIRTIASRAKPLLGAGIRPHPGRRDVSGTLAAVARVLCDERSLSELSELRAFAEAELAAHPGAGLSNVVEAADPTKCTPKSKPQRGAVTSPKKPTGPTKRPLDESLFPKKAPLGDDR